MPSKTTNKFSPEVRTRAVRMVQEHEGDQPSRPVRKPDVQGLSSTDQGLVRDDDANASFTAAESFDHPQANG
jgi:hypothetical protein